MAIELEWMLFKQSGKFAYEGKATISGRYRIWHVEELLNEISLSQIEVVPRAITSREYFLMIRETREQAVAPDYHGFYTALFPAADPSPIAEEKGECASQT